MLPDPKKIAALVIAKGKPAAGDDGAGGDGAGDGGDSLDAAASDFLDAVDAKDPKALADAFKAMWQLLESTEPDAS